MQAKIGFCFFHGWSFDSDYWAPLCERLPKPHTFWDQGYFSKPQRPDLSAAECWIGVGHSQGFMRLVSLEKYFIKLIGINAFTQFHQNEYYPDGVSPRVISRMLCKAKTKPKAVLFDFYQACDFNSNFSKTLNEKSSWLDDLALLKHSEIHIPQKPCLILNGQLDNVTPIQHTRRCFAHHPFYKEHPNASHNLVHQFPKWCQKQILEFVSPVETVSN